MRMRYEYQEGFDVRGYNPAAKNGLVLTRIMLDFNLRIADRARAFLQLRDARPIWSRLGQDDFASNNPLGDWCDIRQAFIEWLRIAGSPIGIKTGRQQLSYGNQRVFGPGLWGNTGRYVWDALMLKIDLSFLGLDIWTGQYIKNRPDNWPNRAFDNPKAFVAYGSVKNLPMALDIFHATKYDGSGNIAGEIGRGDLLSHSYGIQTRGQVKHN
ncbi:MAG: alginate export family protein, partial [candidate division Zixibacteria bacterium]|nr:alginate export family protein [candidate division Zixibacteria bacterium]